jgi:hypothetical protein
LLELDRMVGMLHFALTRSTCCHVWG